MPRFLKARRVFFCLNLFLSIISLPISAQTAHTWEMQEIVLHATKPHPNAYKDVDVWVQLQGPNFSKRVYGFWDGGDVWRVRVLATSPGKWTWTSDSNQSSDSGLNGKAGGFVAKDWTEAEKNDNPTRHGFLRNTPNQHALEYADGSPFFLVGDTWLGALTWRSLIRVRRLTPTTPRDRESHLRTRSAI